MAGRRSVILVADTTRPELRSKYGSMRDWIAGRADVVGEFGADGECLPDDCRPDLALVFGGDGTLLTQARRLADRNIPLVGINFGLLGFLAAFDWESLREHADVVFGDDPPIQDHMMFEVGVSDASGRALHAGLAINDAVVTAGAPFRMIRLHVDIDGAAAPAMTGDGVIVSTPTGSTAYNVSVGGPIVSPGLDAMILTPLAPHSLAFRPIVLSAAVRLEIEVARANEGTTLMLDGRVTVPLREGHRIAIARHPSTARFVDNPSNTFWGVVKEKLNWAASPSYRQP